MGTEAKDLRGTALVITGATGRAAGGGRHGTTGEPGLEPGSKDPPIGSRASGGAGGAPVGTVAGSSFPLLAASDSGATTALTPALA